MKQEPWSPERVVALAGGYWASCALHAAMQSGILPRLEQGPATPGELVFELGLHPRGVEPLLTALLTLGLLQRQGEAFGLVPEVAGCFEPGGPYDLGGAVLHMADMMSHWNLLQGCLQTGQPVELKSEDGQGRDNFYRAMRDLARRQTPGLARRLGLTAGQHLLDLGGGPGVYGLAFAGQVPGLEVTVFDLPGSREAFELEAKGHAGEAGTRRLDGDYRTHSLQGPYDVIWLSQILHAESREACIELLKKAAGALRPGGVLWVQEFVVDHKGQGHPFAALFALNMLINTSAGKGYTLKEISSMLEAAGLKEVSEEGPTHKGTAASLVRAVKPK